MHAPQPLALVAGRPAPLDQARMAVTDDGVARGDGAFETVGVWGGVPFRLADHLQRLQDSLASLTLPPADLALLDHEVTTLLDAAWSGHDRPGDGVLRIYQTASGTRVLTIDVVPDRPDPVRLSLQPAPWIRPVEEHALAGVKSMSYGPNMAASRRARAAGFDDALLHSHPERWVLEGPTFGVVVVVDGQLWVPETPLGIVDSISRRTLVEVATAEGLEVRPGRFEVDVLARAEEVVVSSSVRDAVAVQRVGDVVLPTSHPVRDTLSRELWRRRRGTVVP